MQEVSYRLPCDHTCVLVKDLCGFTHVLSIRDLRTTTAESIYTRCQLLTHIPRHQNVLIHNGRRLQDDATPLVANGIHSGSMIEQTYTFKVATTLYPVNEAELARATRKSLVQQ